MAEQEIHNPKDFSEILRALLTTDPAHADTFNPLFERLINNDVYLKALIEGILSASNGHQHSGTDGDGAKIPFTNIEVPAEMGSIVTADEMLEHVNERNPHGTRPSDIGTLTTTEIQQKITQAISDLIQGAPGALDTLNELAQALGDDPNFATTITNLINAKYTKPGTGIPKADLAAAIQASLDKAEASTPKSVFDAHQADGTSHITAQERTAWNAKSNFSGSYNDLTNKPTIPTLNNTLTSTSTTQALTAAQGRQLNLNIGTLSSLNTSSKTNIVSAVNELFTNVSDGKTLVGGAIAGVDPSVVIPTDPTFQQLVNAIESISTGKKFARGSSMCSANTKNFTAGNGNANTNNYLEVDGLDFTPSIVIAYYKGGNSGNITVLDTEASFIGNYGEVRILTASTTYSSSSGTIRGYKLDGIEAFVRDGFRIPVLSTISYRHEWLAIQ